MHPSLGILVLNLAFWEFGPKRSRTLFSVQCKFGLVPKGSVLSYQQPPAPSKSLYDKSEISVPYFNFTCLSFPPTVLEEKEQLMFESHSVKIGMCWGNFASLLQILNVFAPDNKNLKLLQLDYWKEQKYRQLPWSMAYNMRMKL